MSSTLLRLVLRRERIVAPTWIALIAIVGVLTAPYYGRRFSDPLVARAAVDEIRANPALLAFGGQIPDESLAGLVVWKVRVFVYLLLALAVVFTVVRHTRGEEEAGRHELVRAGVVGRHSGLTAALVAAGIFSTVVGLLLTAGYVVYGFPLAGSIAYGLGAVLLAWFFAGVAAIAAQVAQTARVAGMLGFVAILFSDAVRFVADGAGLGWLRWLSPEGWSHELRPYGAEQWWVAGLLIAATAAAIVWAYRLEAARDLGAGLLTERPGPARGDSLRTAFRLGWRLQRGMLFGWMAGIGVAAVFLGGIAARIPAIAQSGGVATQEFFRRYAASGSATLVDAYLWLIVLTFGYIAALYPALAALKVRAEESGGHAELLLATRVSRLRWAAGHLVFAFGGTVIVLAFGGLVTGVLYGAAVGDLAHQVPRMVGGALVQVPAVWTLGGLTVLAVGLLPRLSAVVAWAGFCFVNVFGEILGPVLGIPYWVADLAVPFHHVPKIVSGGDFAVTGLLGLVAITVMLTAAGLAILRRRDIPVS